MLSQAQLERFQSRLKALKEELIALLSMNEQATETVSLDQAKVGRLSRMDALQQQAMAQANRTQHQQRLRNVQLALTAIEEQSYGFCEECGEDIPIARLEASPESIYCITCKNRLEQN